MIEAKYQISIREMMIVLKMCLGRVIALLYMGKTMVGSRDHKTTVSYR